MAQSYKSLKEDFVSNLSGGSIWEINHVTAVAPVSSVRRVQSGKCWLWLITLTIISHQAAVLLWSALQSQRDFFAKYDYVVFMADFLLNVGAILAAITIYSSTPIALNLFLILPAASLYLFPSASRVRQKRPAQPASATGRMEKDQEKSNVELIPERPYITNYRGSMMVVTCVAILAVDFKVYPRRFAKVETWGTSLMDMGVGSFVFSAGLISARPILKAQMTGRASSVGASLKAAARHSLPLLLLGLVRLYSVKGLDYAEHISEYGVHWNFFFTLALLPLSGALLQASPQGLSSVHFIALLIISSSEAILNFTSLQAYILTAPRVGFLGQNREGVFSFFGYLSIFLVGQAIGLDILPRKRFSIFITLFGGKIKLPILTRLFLWSAWFSVLLFLAHSYRTLGLLVSRRLANLPYVLWVSAFNCAQLTLFCAIERLMFPGTDSATDKRAESRKCKHATSRVLAAYNKNGLAIFLLANLLTGAVNLSTDTLGANKVRAIATLSVYAGTLTVVAITLHQQKISVKL